MPVVLLFTMPLFFVFPHADQLLYFILHKKKAQHKRWDEFLPHIMEKKFSSLLQIMLFVIFLSEDSFPSLRSFLSLDRFILLNLSEFVAVDNESSSTQKPVLNCPQFVPGEFPFTQVFILKKWPVFTKAYSWTFSCLLVCFLNQSAFLKLLSHFLSNSIVTFAFSSKCQECCEGGSQPGYICAPKTRAGGHIVP